MGVGPDGDQHLDPAGVAKNLLGHVTEDRGGGDHQDAIVLDTRRSITTAGTGDQGQDE